MGQLIQQQWNTCAITHTGNIRSHNEDAYLNLSQQHLWLVADGMGGHTAGDVASRMLVDELEDYSSTPLFGCNVGRIRRHFQQVNDKLLNLAGDDENNIIGCTVAALTIHHSHSVCLWVGDSRIYRYRHGILRQITRDHSELDELLDRGVSLEDALQSPFAQTITRAIGASSRLAVETQISEIWDGDIYLLCSDGLNKELTDEEIREVLINHTAEDSVEVMLRMALQRKGQDNITVMTVYQKPPALP